MCEIRVCPQEEQLHWRWGWKLVLINLQAEEMRENLKQGKQRETRWQQHAEQLLRERETLAALYCADRRRHSLAQQVLQSTFASASSELATRLARL
jgi:hypothetical protein